MLFFVVRVLSSIKKMARINFTKIVCAAFKLLFNGIFDRSVGILAKGLKFTARFMDRAVLKLNLDESPSSINCYGPFEELYYHNPK